MPSRSSELEDFKSQISLVDYAAAAGYEIDRAASSRTSVGMKHPTTGDKIIIGMGQDRHSIYFSVHDPNDHGSIIDFIQNRQNVSLGAVRTILRPWLDGAVSTPPPPSGHVHRLEPVVKDLAAVRARLAEMQPITSHHAYLVDERHIPMQIITSERIRGRVLVDDRSNAIFPHWDQHGQHCGYEIKNSGFTGFAPGGVKGLWAVGKRDDDTHMVISETAIDALSYFTLHPSNNTRLVSTAGTMNPQQPALLRQAIANMPPGTQIISAVDHDEGGDAIAEQIKAIFNALRRTDITLKRDSPPTAGQDWNDALRASQAKTEPSPPGLE